MPHDARFTIRTAPGANYFAKLVDAASGLTDMMFYIRGGSSITKAVPLGNYVLKYASGNSWCNEDDLFGSDTSTNQADDTFLFERRTTEYGYSTSHWTVELIRQRGGNLRTRSIPRSLF
jgi:hypothetical protein